MGIIKALGTIDKELTKKGIAELAQNDVNQVITSAQFDLLKVYIELKRYENYLSEVMELIKPLAVEKALEQGEKTLEIEHAKVRLQHRTTYDFSSDDKWVALKESLKTSQTTIKEHEEILKTLTDVTEVVDEETGELYQIFPPEKKESAMLVVSF
jgi:hypothetical protein